MRPALLKLAFVLFLFAPAALTSCQAEPPRAEIQFSNPDGTQSPQISAELALTASEQRLGLMYRKSLPETGGMLFVFRDEQPRSFWMKNTYLELDIIFLDKDLRVVSISEKAVPLTETPRSSTGPAKYVLEVGGGKCRSWKVVSGSKAKFLTPVPEATP